MVNIKALKCENCSSERELVIIAEKQKSLEIGVQDQYSDGKAAKVWNLYIGGKQRTDEYRDYIVNLLKEHNVQSVLDCACGTGVDSILLIEAGFTVKSVDASDKMLKYALKTRWERRKEDAFDNWEIGEGDWLDLDNCEDSIHHPEVGYDCVLCLGNSFAHLPDFDGNQGSHTLAIENFHKMLKPGGILLIDHRNYDHIAKHGKLPNSCNHLYYQGDKIHQIKVSVLNVDGECKMITLDYEIDISNCGIDDGSEPLREKPDGRLVPVSQFRLSYYPHTLEKFGRLLRETFGEEAEHHVLPDFQRNAPEDYSPSYWVHVIKRV